MTSRNLRSTFAVLLIALLLFTAQPVAACGPYTLDAVFTFTAHPEFPLEKYAAGEIGVVQPSLARSYLFVAYRHLSGIPFNEQEQKALVSLWNDRLNYAYTDHDEDWPKIWLTARQKVPGVTAAPKIGVDRRREKPNEYESYLNCHQDAFETAASVLDQRIKKFGLDSSAVKDWIAGQDQAFANCSDGQAIPQNLPAGADPLLRADRAYQIAAATFYAADFDNAKVKFEAISQDKSSPWRETSGYLVARSLLRKASLGPAEKKNESLAQAEEQLTKILHDSSFVAVQPAAGRLLNLVRLRFHPEAKLHELAQALLKKNNETLKQDLWDYTTLMDQLNGEDSAEKPNPSITHWRQDDLTDWVNTIDTGGAEALDHSLQRWHETSSIPWLVASLTKVKAGSPQVAALLSAAAKVDQTSPAYASTSFQQVRLALEAGKPEQARAQLDELLARNKTLPVSSRNLFLSLRMRLATNLSEFLTFAQRKPAGFSWNEDEREMTADPSDDTELKEKEILGRNLFDVDATRTLNEKLPLSVLQQAAESKVLPTHLRRDLAQAIWLRAAMLDQPETARQLVPTLKILIPEMKPLLDEYQSALADEASKFSAIYAWLKTPGLQPIVTAGIGRRTALNEQDSLRDNWWCGAAFKPETTTEGDGGEKEKENLSLAVNMKSQFQSPAFLTVAQKAAARAEQAKLAALGAAPNYLCRQVIQWVERHPDDPRSPEALHLAVKSTRYGCTDKETGKWSKAAFDVLHKRYPTDAWAKKTPYWFKD